MNRFLPVILLLFICVCIVPLFELPGSLTGLIVKGLFGFCVLLLLKVAYNKMVLPGTLIGTIFFALAWWYAPDWPMYIFLLLMLGALFVTMKTAETYYGKSGNRTGNNA